MGRYLKNCTIYAVDFDGTLCTNKFPEIGVPNVRLIKWLIDRKAAGDKVILWTNRVEPYCGAAVAWCAERGLFFDAVNENLPEIVELFAPILNGQPPSPKITADIVIDDQTCSAGLPFGDPGCHMTNCWSKMCLRKKLNKVEAYSELMINNVPSTMQISSDRKYIIVSNNTARNSCLLFWGHLTDDDEPRSFDERTPAIDKCERYTLDEIVRHSTDFTLWKPEMTPKTFLSEPNVIIEPKNLSQMGLSTMRIYYPPQINA